MAAQSLYWISFILYIIAFILTAIGVGTGYWYVANGGDMKFQRLGLWEVCFNGYEHPSDLMGKAYYGCWWIFHKEYSYIKEWILPPWWIAVQTLMVIAVVVEFITLPLFIPAMTPKSTRVQTLVCVLVLLTLFCITVPVVIFPVMIGMDRTWMPRYDVDRPNWSFAIVVVAGFLSALSCMFITVYMLMNRYEKAKKNNERQQLTQLMPMVSKA